MIFGWQALIRNNLKTRVNISVRVFFWQYNSNPIYNCSLKTNYRRILFDDIFSDYVVRCFLTGKSLCGRSWVFRGIACGEFGKFYLSCFSAKANTSDNVIVVS